MTQDEQVMAFADDLDKLVRYYEAEFDLSYANVIAALEFKKHTLCAQMVRAQQEGRSCSGGSGG